MTALTVGNERRALHLIADALGDAGCAPRRRGDHIDARCPAHDDRTPSLSVDWRDGALYVCCQTGCTTEDVMTALGLPMRDLYDTPSETRDRAPRPRRQRAPRQTKPAAPACQGTYREHAYAEVTRYPYADARGTLVGYRVRKACRRDGCDAKSFGWRRLDAAGSEQPGRPDPLPLYRLPDVLAALDDGTGVPIYVTEGEKDADAVTAAGGVACTMGAADNGRGSTWKDHHTAALIDAAEVIVCADRDDTGRRSAAYIADQLHAAGIPVRIAEAAEGKDVADHLAAGHALDQLRELHPTDADPEGVADRGEGRSMDDDPDQTIDLRDRDDAAGDGPGNVHTLPGVDPEEAKLPPGARSATWVRHGAYGTDGRRTWERKGNEWVKILDAHVRFLAARTAAPDPDFPDRAEDGDDQDLEARTDVEVTTEDDRRVRTKVYRGVRTSNLRKLKPLDQYGPRAWQGADVSPAGTSRLFRAITYLSSVQGIEAVDFYAVTGWHPHPDGRGEMFVHGGGAIGPAGDLPGVEARVGDHIGAFRLGEPAAGRDLVDGFAELAALVACGALPARMLWPLVGAGLRPLFGQYRDPGDDADLGATVSAWLSAGYGSGKSGAMAAGLNAIYPGLRWNTFPLKAGSTKSGGTSGPALERILFRGRDLLLPFDDCDPSEPEASRAAWQSDLLRRAAGQYGRALAQRTGNDTRAAMPCRAGVMATGEPLDAEASAASRTINIPVDQGDVRISVLRQRTGADERAARGRVGAGLVAVMAGDREHYRERLAAARRGLRPMFVAREAPGPVERAADVFTELAATLRVVLSVMVDEGMSRHDARRAWAVIRDGLREAWRAHLTVIGAGDRGARALAYLRTALQSGAMRLDDKGQGQGTPSLGMLGWERRPADPGFPDQPARPMSLVVGGYQDADSGDLLLLPEAATKVVKALADGAGDSWTGGTKALAAALKSSGYLHVPDGQGRSQEATTRLRVGGANTRVWQVRADRFNGEDGGGDYLGTDFSGPLAPSGMPLPWVDDEGAPGSAPGCTDSATCGAPGSAPGAKPAATCGAPGAPGKSAPQAPMEGAPGCAGMALPGVDDVAVPGCVPGSAHSATCGVPGCVPGAKPAATCGVPGVPGKSAPQAPMGGVTGCVTGSADSATCDVTGSVTGATPAATCDITGVTGKSDPQAPMGGVTGSCPGCGESVAESIRDLFDGWHPGCAPAGVGPTLGDDGLPATCPGCGQPVRHGRADFEGWHVACAPAEVQARGVALRTAREAARAPEPAPEGGSAQRAGNGAQMGARGSQEPQRRAVDRTAVLVLEDGGAALVVAEAAGTRYPIPAPARVGDLAREAAALDLTRVWIPTDTLTGLGLAELPEPRRAEDVTGIDHPWSEPAPGVEQRGPRGLGSWMTFSVPEVREWPVYVAIPAWMGSRHPLRELDAADVAEALRLFAAAVGTPLALEVWTARNILAKEAGARRTDGAQRSHKRGLAPCAAILTGQVPRATFVREDGTVTAGAGFTMVPPRWERALTDDERAATHVHKYDGNAAYLASYGATPLGLGEPEHRDGPVTFDRKRAGYWRVDELPAHGIPGMPPFRVKTVRDGQTWLTTPEADLLARLGILPEVREAVVWPESSRRLDTMSRRLREAREELRTTRGTPAGDAAWSLAGFMHQAPAQYLARNGAAPDPAKDRTNAALFRPDWRDQIISHVRVSHWWRLYRAQQESGRAPVFVNEDAAAYAADASDPAAAVPRGLVLGTSGGQYKPEGHVPMNAFLKFRKRPDSGFMTAFDRAKGGE